MNSWIWTFVGVSAWFTSAMIVHARGWGDWFVLMFVLLGLAQLLAGYMGVEEGEL
jgi:hypothetical protein